MDLEFSQLERLRRIGRGPGGTTVYKAIHRPSGKIYAVKVIHGCYEEAVHANLRRQMDTLREVRSPNVVKCHGAIFAHGEIQLILEYVEKSLKGAFIPHEPSLSNLARQILAALAHLHDRMIVHRAVKPSNLMVDSCGVVKIADFGVSPILAQTADHFDPAILEYICPERINTDLIRGEYDGFAGDIWSLGICMLEFYSGEFPFPAGRGGDWGRLMRAICLAEPPEAPPCATVEFRDFVACCLRKDPARRRTAAQLLEHPFVAQYVPPERQWSFGDCAAGGEFRSSSPENFRD